jgi:hypothetical protein
LYRPAAGTEPLRAAPADAERHTFKAAVLWLIDGKLLIHPAQEAEIHRLLRDSVWTISAPAADAPIVTAPAVSWRGTSRPFSRTAANVAHGDPQRLQHGVGHCLRLRWALHKEARSGEVAANLLDYTFVTRVPGTPAQPADPPGVRVHRMGRRRPPGW